MLRCRAGVLALRLRYIANHILRDETLGDDLIRHLIAVPFKILKMIDFVEIKRQEMRAFWGSQIGQ